MQTKRPAPEVAGVSGEILVRGLCDERLHAQALLDAADAYAQAERPSQADRE